MSEPTRVAGIDKRELHDLVRAANRLRSRQTPAGEFQDLARQRDAVLEPRDRDFIHLYAAAGVAARDLDAYLRNNPGEPKDFFDMVILPIVKEDQREFPATTMFGKEPPERVPDGYAEAAASGAPTLAGLDDPAIIHEWTSKPGKRMFKKFGEQFKVTICGPNGPYEQFEDKVGSVLGPSAIVASVTASGLTVAAFLIPLLVLFAVILVKTGLKTYCGP
jgi:hypothetical protein